MKKTLFCLMTLCTLFLSLVAGCGFESDEERDQRLIREEIEKRRR